MKHLAVTLFVVLYAILIAIAAMEPGGTAPDPEMDLMVDLVRSWSGPAMPLCPHELYNGETAWMKTCEVIE